jgi:hypothetical protein
VFIKAVSTQSGRFMVTLNPNVGDKKVRDRIDGQAKKWKGRHGMKVPANTRCGRMQGRVASKKSNNQQGLTRGRQREPWGGRGPEDDGAGGGRANITTNHRWERQRQVVAAEPQVNGRQDGI